MEVGDTGRVGVLVCVGEVLDVGAGVLVAELELLHVEVVLGLLVVLAVAVLVLVPVVVLDIDGAGDGEGARDTDRVGETHIPEESHCVHDAGALELQHLPRQLPDPHCTPLVHTDPGEY